MFNIMPREYTNILEEETSTPTPTHAYIWTQVKIAAYFGFKSFVQGFIPHICSIFRLELTPNCHNTSNLQSNKVNVEKTHS